jgi:hypothetical protein
MRKKIFISLIIIAILLSFTTTALSQIVVEDAGSTWVQPLNAVSVAGIWPRITVEYATVFIDKDLVFPTDLIDSTLNVRSRIRVEYATTMLQFDMKKPPCKGDFDGDGDVDGYDLSGLCNDLNRLPMIIFNMSYGRSNCLD